MSDKTEVKDGECVKLQFTEIL